MTDLQCWETANSARHSCPGPAAAAVGTRITITDVSTSGGDRCSIIFVSVGDLPPGLLRQSHFPDCYRGRNCLLDSCFRGELFVSGRVTVSRQTARVLRLAGIFCMAAWRYRSGSSVRYAWWACNTVSTLRDAAMTRAATDRQSNVPLSPGKLSRMGERQPAKTHSLLST